MEKGALKLSNRSMVVIVCLLAGIFIAGGTWWWLRASRIVSTDDARVRGAIVSISSKVGGRLEKVLIHEGDQVQADQVIAVIEPQEYAVQVEQAKANLAMAEAQLAAAVAGNRPQEIAQANAAMLQAKANLENARKNAERDEKLYQQGAVSVQHRDASNTAYDIANAQYLAASEQYSLKLEGSRQEDLQMAQAQVQQARAALKTAELHLADTTVKAPVSGVVALKSVEPGEIISAGQQMFSITDLSDVWIGANIEETYIGRIQVGQPVAVTVDAYPGREFTGQVSEVGAAAGSQFALLSTENSSGNFTKVTQRLPIKVRVKEADVQLKPGMSAIISIRTK